MVGPQKPLTTKQKNFFFYDLKNILPEPHQTQKIKQKCMLFSVLGGGDPDLSGSNTKKKIYACLPLGDIGRALKNLTFRGHVSTVPSPIKGTKILFVFF